MGMDEATILRAVIAGNKEIYSLLVKRYMKKAYYIAVGFLHSPDDALDISQEAFIKAFRAIKRFDVDHPFFPWFYTILKNLCFDFLKKRKKKETALNDLYNNRSSHVPDASLTRDDLWQLLDQLPSGQKEVIILKSIYGHSYREIAQITRKPVGTVMSSLFYARKNLKNLLGELP